MKQYKEGFSTSEIYDKIKSQFDGVEYNLSKDYLKHFLNKKTKKDKFDIEELLNHMKFKNIIYEYKYTIIEKKKAIIVPIFFYS